MSYAECEHLLSWRLPSKWPCHPQTTVPWTLFYQRSLNNRGASAEPSARGHQHFLVQFCTVHAYKRQGKRDLLSFTETTYQPAPSLDEFKILAFLSLVKPAGKMIRRLTSTHKYLDNSLATFLVNHLRSAGLTFKIYQFFLK